MTTLPPPPPTRRNRPPFVTSFLEGVLPFMSARDLLVCATVCRSWREESRSLPLWRALLTSDRRTACYGYQGLALEQMQRIAITGLEPQASHEVLGGGSDPSGDRLEAGSFSPVEQGESVMALEAQEMGLISVVGVVSSGADSRAAMWTNRGDMYSHTWHTVHDVQRSLETVQTYRMQLRDNINASRSSLDVLSVMAPSCENIWLIQLSSKLLKRLKVFEEIVTNTLSLSDEENVSLRGLRTFVQVEIAASRQVESAIYHRWYQFKQVLPLDDEYYDYRDLLYSLGLATEYPTTLSSLETDLVVKRINENKRIQTVIDTVMKVKMETNELSWTSLTTCCEAQ